ncbi:MAG: ComEC family DNA internalization-related competence protein [Bacilli bacterium]|nr:ComEC family DNA internalization-related competence protein [Bacilli bacterium]
MKEEKFSLLIIGYILSFLTHENVFFLILNIILFILIVYKKKNYKFYLLGCFILLIRMILVNNNYEDSISSTYLLINVKPNYVILINNKLQCFLNYDLTSLNMFSVIKVEGRLEKILPSSNFDIFSFKDFLRYRNIKYELIVDEYSLISEGDTLRPKIIDFLLKGLDNTSLSMVDLLLFGNKNNLIFYNNLIKTGVVQMVVVSGFHFNALESVLSKIKIKWIDYFIFIFFSFYLYVLNFQIAATRAFFAYLLRLLSKRFGFLNNYFNFLIILSAFLLFNPFYLYHIGFILSFFLTFMLIFIKELRINKYLKSIIVYICALPIIISMNNEFHIFSFIYQLVLTLPVTILFYLSWIVLIFKFLSPIYLLFCNIFVNIVDFLAKIPGMIIFKEFTHVELLVFYLVIFIICYLLAIKLKKKLGIFICIILTLFIYKYNYSFIYEKESVVFFDVGQGDSTLISLGHNKGHILIDTGGSFTYDYATKIIIPYLKANGIRKLDYVLISHDDYDHNGALNSLVSNFKVKNILNASEFDLLEYKEFKIYNLNYGSNYLEDNEKSGVFYFEMFNNKFLIMADASVNVEKDILTKYKLDIDYLRVGHHGSNTSSSYDFLANINCNNAIISVGKYNKYGHPHKEVLNNLERLKYNVFRTDLYGMIIITCDRIKTRFDV